MKQEITFRPITPQDTDFLYEVYASTREDELSVLDWNDEEKTRFLKMQFQAQHVFYQEQFSEADFDIILLRRKPIGRLYVDKRADEIRIIDIALLPKHRRKGIGAYLLKNVLAKAQQANLPVRIHVERNNPALGLYNRLGFRQIDDQGVYYLMEWSPEV